MRIFTTVSCFILAFLLPCYSDQAQNQTDQKIKEYVKVVNVQLLLRVMEDGRTRGGFKKEDFKLFEDGRERPINGFFEVSRRMGKPIDLAPDRPRPGRLFLLFFWLNQPQEDIRVQLDYFFEKIYQPGDRVIISSTSRIFELWEPQKKSEVLESFYEHWREESDNYRKELVGINNDLFNLVRETLDLLLMSRSMPEEDAERFIENCLDNFRIRYHQEVNSWQMRYHRVFFNKMETMARDLEKVNAEKWALVFYERDVMPLVDIQKFKNELMTYFDVNLVRNFESICFGVERKAKTGGGLLPVYETLRTRFIQAGTVFHLLQMSSRHFVFNDASFDNAMTRIEHVYSNWDGLFQEISQVSGGRKVDLDRGVGALDTLLGLDDIYYVITYVPDKQAGRKRKIEMKLVNPDLKHLQRQLVYGQRLEMEELPEVKIRAIFPEPDKLEIILADYYPITSSEGLVGCFSVTVAGLKDDYSDALVLFERDIQSTGKLEIPLSFPETGNWQLLVRVSDLMSGRQAMARSTVSVDREIEFKQLSPEIGQHEKKELNLLLIKAAAYAERLRKIALRFICIEEITEQSLDRKKGLNQLKFDRNSWHHEYQIVLDQGKISERRLLIKRNRKTFNPPPEVEIEAFFQSENSVLLPATMLAHDRQQNYDYRIRGREKINNHDTVRLMVKAIKPDSGMPGGEIWLDPENGAVWQIKLDPETVKGFAHHYAAALKKNVKVTISDVHKYFVGHKGIQFPSATEIIENNTFSVTNRFSTLYNKTGLATLEVRRVIYSYYDYRFFDIKTHEQILDVMR